MKDTLTSVFAIVAALTLWTKEAQAVPVTAYELIQDLNAGGGSTTRNLDRTRFDGGATTVTESNDAIIRSQNAVDSNFGIYNPSDVTYSHKSDWLAANAFLSATLVITASGVHNSIPANDTDYVFAETFQLGSLIVGQIGVNPPGAYGQSTTTFNFFGNLITTYLVDDTLNILIEKNANESDKIEIISSKLSLTYEQPVPDGGATLMLLTCGLLGIVYTRNRLTA